MLENCVNLQDCESRLTEAVKQVTLLGEIPLSDQDVEILVDLIKEALSPGISKGTRSLKTRYLASLACFLVGMGRFYDKESGFWPVVEKKIGPIDVNWKVKWGKLFLQFLNQNHLPAFDEEEGLSYVTPILAHACIPDTCLDEFFDRVLVSLVNRDLVNPLDHEEILHDLKVRRSINNNRLQLERSKKEHEDKLKEFQNASRELHQLLSYYQVVASLLDEEDELGSRGQALQGLEDAESSRQELIKLVQESVKRKQKLEAEAKHLYEELSLFENKFLPILENEIQINESVRTYLRLTEQSSQAQEDEKSFDNQLNILWTGLSSQLWEESYRSEILQLPVELLIDYLENIPNLQEQWDRVQAKIKSLQASLEAVPKPRPSVLSLLTFLLSTLLGTSKRETVRQANELQQLYTVSNNVEAEIKREQSRVKELFARLPVREELLTHPESGLEKEIIALQKACRSSLEAIRKREQLEGEEVRLANHVQNLCPVIGIPFTGKLDAWIDVANKFLTEAHQRRESAHQTKQYLENELLPILDASRAEYNRLRAELETLDNRLTELGGGSLQQGLSLIYEFRQAQAKFAQKRHDLTSRLPDISSLESDIKSKGYPIIKKILEEGMDVIENQVQEIEGELKRLEEESSRFPAQYFGIDEPIRRFLLYGGAAAEKVLTNSVILLATDRSGATIEDILEPGLPDRILRHFHLWWDDHKMRNEVRTGSDDEINLTTGERFRAPQFFFDPVTGEVIAVLPVQRFLRPEGGISAKLEVQAGEHVEPFVSEQLRLYRRTKELVETQPLENIHITIPAHHYIFRLKVKDHLIHEWEVQGIQPNAPFLAFSTITYKRIKGESLPRSSLILVLHRHQSIQPEDCILSDGGHLFGGWREYIWYELDLTSTEHFCLLRDDGQRFSISISSHSGDSVELVGGKLLSGVNSAGKPVFNLPPVFLRIHLQDQSDLRLLRLSIFDDGEQRARKSKHYQIDELAYLVNHDNKGVIDIPLTADQILGADPTGCFTIRVYQPPHLDWQTSFCILPDLEVIFDQEMYAPFRGEIPNITAVLALPERSSLKPDTPAKLVSKEKNSWEIQAPLCENSITGIFEATLTVGARTTFPLTVLVPKVRWRILGIDEPEHDPWSDEVKEELWIGDWMEAPEAFLLVDLPWFFTGEVSLLLAENAVSVDSGKLQDHRVRFDLRALEDILRAGPSLEKFCLSLSGVSSTTWIDLFTIRTRWLAEKIKCFHYPEGDAVRVDVSWKEEKGKAGQKTARLWYLSSVAAPELIQEVQVRQNICEAAFRSTAAEVKSGKYLVHLEPFDPWSPPPVCPDLKDPNSTIIEIVTETPEKAIVIQSISVDPKHFYHLPPGSYRIKMIGKVINQKLPDKIDEKDTDDVVIVPLNENWYVGNLEVKGIPEVIDHLVDTNPVKVEYDTQKNIVTSIEDQYGEGAMYCYECRMLFWSQETLIKEKKNSHRNYGPIEEFRVKWESE